MADITFDTLYELLRKEKLNNKLQELESSFYGDVTNYIRLKKEMIDSKKESIFSSSEAQKIKKQLENSKKIINELYERRERKIIELALAASRLNSMPKDIKLLKEEKELFERIKADLDHFRNAILAKILKGENPCLEMSPLSSSDLSSKVEAEKDQNIKSMQEDKLQKEEKQKIGNQETKNPEQESKILKMDNIAKKTILVRFLEAVPEIVGEDLNIYGPFNPEDIANLPKKVAEVLIKQNKAQAIQ